VKKETFRILIIDDDEIARDVVVSLLSKEGFSVIAARDGLEGIKALRMEDYQLVVTDLRMPGADGIEVLKTALRLNPTSSVVIMTAYGTLDNALEAVKLGAFDYITKPFKLQEIIIVVENAFKRFQMIREREELRQILRETYRDLEIIRNIQRSGHPELAMQWTERMNRLKDMEILNLDETDILRERLVKGYGQAQNINSR
jgi:DNA-binding NtrC family response regulator